MLVPVETKSQAPITMFGDVAVTLIEMTGQSGTVPSALLAQDMRAALSRRLKAAVAAHASEPLNPREVSRGTAATFKASASHNGRCS